MRRLYEFPIMNISLFVCRKQQYYPMIGLISSEMLLLLFDSSFSIIEQQQHFLHNAFVQAQMCSFHSEFAFQYASKHRTQFEIKTFACKLVVRKILESKSKFLRIEYLIENSKIIFKFFFYQDQFPLTVSATRVRVLSNSYAMKFAVYNLLLKNIFKNTF